MTGTITIIMVFSIPLVAILTSHYQRVAKIKHNMIKDEIELERLKHENYLLETEKMKLELSKLESPLDKTHVL
ncbi:hypothetical protein QNH36_04170 [Mesobacillus sp. AQ2]|jgi:hypothetical protein|uniref:hypothetical protein n=1 Tax=unclassified Mesobacillus TaxID=2675270 RepID=UPI00203F0DE0|nr:MULTISPECIES: hypothetical protein [unclassified Mesobacillus]MCM3125530.1 hypothetical protein [Mesobacillus sp. MER 33]MCM3234426.1 hypothetical protein [Mesobacillus sp. MER 48]WHX41363.1 hypothetical protein QNH36_04170 [Mesobacillus sp. AQ2]